MSISSLTSNAWTPATRAAASDSITSLFAQPKQKNNTSAASPASSGGTTAASPGITLGQIASELQALLLQLQGGASSGTNAAGGSQAGSVTASTHTQSTGTGRSAPGTEGNDATGTDGNGTSTAASDSSVPAWLAKALQAYAPAAILGGPLGGLAAAAIA